jgi:hypothetical protein
MLDPYEEEIKLHIGLIRRWGKAEMRLRIHADMMMGYPTEKREIIERGIDKFFKRLKENN